MSSWWRRSTPSQPYGDIDEYAVKMFENHGRGIGERGRDNGLLILVAVKERRVQFEVGYELEQFITDGFSGQTSREDMAPSFRRGEYGEGMLAGTTARGRAASPRDATSRSRACGRSGGAARRRRARAAA